MPTSVASPQNPLRCLAGSWVVCCQHTSCGLWSWGTLGNACESIPRANWKAWKAVVPYLANSYLRAQFFLVNVGDFLSAVGAILASEELDIHFHDGWQRIVMIRKGQFLILYGHNLMSPFEYVTACDQIYLNSSCYVILLLSMDCCNLVSTSTLRASFFFSMIN